MLWRLAENPSTLVDRTTLYRDVIGREYDGLDRSADVRISRLRKKLQDNSQHPFRIKTIWGKGFFFVADAWDD
jgi:DNA-binding response OmpR family regulator